MSARRVESRLAAILAPENAAGNLIEIVQRMPARLTAVSQDLVLGRARTRPAALGSVIGW